MNPTTGRGAAVRSRASRVVGAAALVACLAIVGASRSAASEPEPEASSCSQDCDRAAAACTDGCEEKFSDPKARVTCKVECIQQREACEARCP